MALEKSAVYREATLQNPKPMEGVANFDLLGLDQAVAGFIVSLPATGPDVSLLASGLVTKITTQLPGTANVAQLVSGTIRQSHDKFPTVVGTQLELTFSAPRNPPSVRNDVLPLLLGRAPSELSQLPPPNFGPGSKNLILAFQERGQGMVEYALLIVLLAVVVIVMIAVMGTAVSNMYTKITQGFAPLIGP